MKNKKLKGFTILETLISLMLMSVIIVITYSLFNLVEKQMFLFNKNNEQLLAYNLFNLAIIKDINKANDFNISGDNLILKNYNDTSIIYSIKNESVTRENESVTEIFKVQVVNYKFMNNDVSKPLNKTLQIKLNVLNDTIIANYFLNKNNSEVINTMYFNED